MEKLRIVLDEDIEQVLNSLGQLEALQSGELFCCECGQPLSVRTIQIIMPLSDSSFEYVCSRTDCVKSYLEKHEVR